MFSAIEINLLATNFVASISWTSVEVFGRLPISFSGTCLIKSITDEGLSTSFLKSLWWTPRCFLGTGSILIVLSVTMATNLLQTWKANLYPRYYCIHSQNIKKNEKRRYWFRKWWPHYFKHFVTKQKSFDLLVGGKQVKNEKEKKQNI